VDHIDAMLEGDANDIILREVRGNGGQTGTNMVCFVGLDDQNFSMGHSKQGD